MTTPKTADSELDEILDIFGHTVINYGQYEGSRTRLKAGAAKRLKALIASQVSAAENRLLDELESKAETAMYADFEDGSVENYTAVPLSVIASHRPQTTDKEERNGKS